MQLRESVPLTELTTFKVGGNARYVAMCKEDAEVLEAVAFAKSHRIPYIVLGSGSNVLPSDDDFNGVVILIQGSGLEVIDEEDTVQVIASAGYGWDALVAEVARHNLWGLENMAGIPGTVGAAPVQNIGAYGEEVSTYLIYVEALNTELSQIERIEKSACGFGYRESIFKHHHTRIILRVAFRFPKEGTPRLGYSDIARLASEGADLSTPEKVGNAVREVRAGKFPDLTVYGTAGSFFKNPVISEATYATLVARYGDVPRFEAKGGVKIPLAFVLDKILSLRGYREGKVWLYGAQPLVLVADNGARAEDVDALASAIEKKVFDATGITIEREVRRLSS